MSEPKHGMEKVIDKRVGEKKQNKRISEKTKDIEYSRSM